MLEAWISTARRDPGPSVFFVDDVLEIASPDEPTMVDFCQLLLDARADPDYLRDMTETLGWEKASQLIEALIPAGKKATSAKRGEFGEILAAKVLEEFHEYAIPIWKLRSAVIGGQVMPGTDILALKLDQGEIKEVCYSEVKLRTGNDSGLAVRAAKQLKEDVQKDLPDILGFVSRRLHESDDPLYDPFKYYMRDREDLEDIDSYVVAVLFDEDAWQESVIQNLIDSDVELSPLYVQAIRLKDLATLTNNAFARIGITTILEDEDEPT